ncbi:putative odorant receptor 85e [Cimex lectularius]|uniref:Odorant receptor n=1 Tax=Cimex lectularius TaxID=79782 RepID=A0A8I6R873_CIMLE|nr:putative odorant receptor 85e [Cimex lectularius]
MSKVTIDVRYFKVIGLWQYLVPESGTNYMVILNLILGILFTIQITIQMWNNILAGYEFSTFTEKFSVNLTCFESAIKMLYYCSQKTSLKFLIKSFNSNFLLCSKHNEEATERVMSKCADFVNRSTKSFMYMIFSTVTVWNALPILKCISGDCGSWQIMPSWYPFDTTYFPVNGLIYIFEFYVMVFCAALLYNVNCLFSALALSIAAQFDLLVTSLSSIPQNAERLAKKESKEEIMSLLLRDCLMDHQNLLRLTKELERMYNPMFLFQMLTSTFTICLVLVQLNEYLGASDQLSIPLACKFIMYLVFGSAELFIYSWGGQIIYDKTSNVHRSLYETGWDQASVKFRKCVLFAMTRSYRPDSLTAGKFYTVDLNSFTQTIKASYSYFTVLRGSDSKKH